jgi:hypothetical protein
MTSHEQSVQIWQVLIAAAHHRQTVTRERLADLIGASGDDLAAPLRRLTRHCTTNGWPPITDLVASETAGNRSASPATVADSPTDRERVFVYPWFRMPLVGVETLEAADQPAKRPCPKCGNEGNAEATLCGYCWARLTPAAKQVAVPAR